MHPDTRCRRIFSLQKTRYLLNLLMAVTTYKSIHPKNRKAWRKWLEKEHQASPGIWLVYYKKHTGLRGLSYDEAVEEALCFGWIDSLPGKLDEVRSSLKFTPRKPKSVWSALNKKRVEQLISQGLMTPSGLASIKLAKKNGSWESLTASDEAAALNKVPPDLEKLFARNKKAGENFKAFSMSVRKQFLSWIFSAKRPETRRQRIDQTVLMSAANVKPGAQGFKLVSSK
jgi:uncharacterized protein YdeI (YjbR/CyaY-like superfamily)